MNEDDIYYVDERNAVISTTRQPGQPGQRVIFGTPRPTGVGPRAISQMGPYGQPSPFGPQGPWGVPPGYWNQRSPYGSPYGASVLDRLSAGKIVDMAAQVFAALMSLPDAPVATADPATDVPNLITYQSSLASYAKRDEQIRTLGSLVAKLVG
ncbi:MAG TPA: hypothetical protein VMJ10_34085 [Kofleriaceae bacterium]|nr:hypothetical protein [Kofleriaceae bacterium]